MLLGGCQDGAGPCSDGSGGAVVDQWIRTRGVALNAAARLVLLSIALYRTRLKLYKNGRFAGPDDGGSPDGRGCKLSDASMRGRAMSGPGDG